MALSAAQHLELIDAAIQDVLAGRASSYSIGSRTVTKLDLSKLYEMRDKYAVYAQREAGSGAFSLAKMGKRSR